MSDQQPKKFSARIAGGTEDSDFRSLLCGHDRPLGLRKAQADSAGTISREARVAEPAARGSLDAYARARAAARRRRRFVTAMVINQAFMGGDIRPVLRGRQCGCLNGIVVLRLG